jgi:N6-adenosine-specific RNA methylase IME4
VEVDIYRPNKLFYLIGYLVARIMKSAREDLLARDYGKFHTIVLDPPWLFMNSTGKVAPEHKRLFRYETMTMEEIKDLPIPELSADKCHLYLWVPNALIQEGLEIMKHWGFKYKTNLIWYKVRKDGGPDRRGVGFYFRNVTEMVLFGVKSPKGENYRTRKPWTIENVIVEQKRIHSRKPDQIYKVVERCSFPPYLELFARYERPNWTQWGFGIEKLQRERRDEKIQKGKLPHYMETIPVLAFLQ